jgi:Ca-activated chloride channel family protein
MAPADRKYVRVSFSGDGMAAEDTRFYYSSTVFGMPLERIPYLLILPFLLALLLWWLLTRIDFEKHFPQPTLEVLDAQLGAPSTHMFSIDQKKTVIGGSSSDDVTIAGAPSVRPEHATIVYDEGSKTYSVQGGGDIQVNNKPVTSKKLEAGDVINVGGTIIVFDEESEQEKQAEPKKKEP